MRRRCSGAKFTAEAVVVEETLLDRGAFYTGRSRTERSGGLYRRENAGMSSDKGSENLPRRNPKDS